MQPLRPDRGQQPAPDIRRRSNQELVDAFENHQFQRKLAEYDDDHLRADHHVREANIVWRELKLRLCPSHNGGPRNVS